MTIPTRPILSTLVANICYMGVDTLLCSRSEPKAKNLITRGFTTQAIKSKPTPVAYPLLQGLGKSYYQIKTFEKVAFITETLFTLDGHSYSLKCSMEISWLGVPDSLKKAVNLTNIVKKEMLKEFDILWDKRGDMTQTEFLQVLFYKVRMTLIYQKGFLLSHTRMEFVKTR